MALSAREESYFPPNVPFTVICAKDKSTMMGLKPSLWLWDCLDVSHTWAPLDLIHKGPPPSPPLPHLNQGFWPLVNTWNMLLLNYNLQYNMMHLYPMDSTPPNRNYQLFAIPFILLHRGSTNTNKVLRFHQLHNARVPPCVVLSTCSCPIIFGLQH